MRLVTYGSRSPATTPRSVCASTADAGARDMDRLLADRPSTRVIANVRQDNPASEAAFRSAGFVVARECRLRGIDAREMVYTGPGTSAP